MYIYPMKLHPIPQGGLFLPHVITDVLEETIDGKNTFHCTQMMLWQRGPVEKDL